MGSEGSFESIRALLSIAKLDVFSYKPDGKVVAIDETKSVAEAMATLRSNKVSSCAVINAAGEYVGAFSHGDLIRNVMKGLEAQLQKDTDATSPETQQEVQRLGESMLTTPVKSYMHAGDLWFVGGADSTVLDALEDMMQEARAHHRLFVCGSMDDARPTGVVSQSDIIQMVWEHRVELSATLQKTLEELNLCQGAAFTMPADTPTVRVLLNMFRDHKSSMGITDTAGDVLLGNLSQSDLCALKPDEFSRLLLPVGHFLCLTRGLPSPEGGGQDWAAALNASPVVKVGKQSALAEALEKLVVHHLHRLYVVDDDNRPLSIITLTDILRPVARSKA